MPHPKVKDAQVELEEAQSQLDAALSRLGYERFGVVAHVASADASAKASDTRA